MTDVNIPVYLSIKLPTLYNAQYETYILPYNSTILDLKYSLATNFSEDIFKIDIVAPKYIITLWGTRPDIQRHCEKLTNLNRYSCILGSAPQYSLFSKQDIMYLKNKYSYNIEPVVTKLTINFNTTGANYPNFWDSYPYSYVYGGYVPNNKALFLSSKYPIFIVDSQTTTEDLQKSLAKILGACCNISFAQKCSLLIGHGVDIVVTVDNYDCQSLTAENVYKINNEIRALSYTKENYIVLKYTRDASKNKNLIYIDSNKLVDSLRTVFDKKYTKDKRYIVLTDKNGVELDYSKKICDVLKDGATFDISELTEIPMKLRPDQEIKKLSLDQFNKNIKKFSDRVDTCVSEYRKRDYMYMTRIPYDVEIVLSDGLEEFYSEKIASAIVMLNSEDNCLLELLQKNKSNYEDAKKGTISIDINDSMFSSFSREQHKTALDAIIRYCYIKKTPSNIEFYINNSECMLAWAQYLGLTNMSGALKNVTNGEFIEEYSKRFGQVNL